jgi:hypothetical protein
MPATAEIKEFQDVFFQFGDEQEQRVAKATAEMLQRLENDQGIAPAEKELGVPAASLRKFTLVYCTQDQPLSSAVRVAAQRTPTPRSLAEECVEHKNVVKMTFPKGPP